MSNKLAVHVVLDRSGSMMSIKNDVIGAFNSYVKELANDDPKAKLSLTIFDTQSIDTIINNEKVKEVQPLTDRSYQPRAGTPLYDAIGKCVQALEAAKRPNKALVIITDGEENSSTEYTLDAIKKLLTEKQEKENWLVLYLAANQDAFQVGRSFGVMAGKAMNFTAAGPQTRAMFSAAARNTVSYANVGSNAAPETDFTDKERDDAQ